MQAELQTRYVLIVEDDTFQGLDLVSTVEKAGFETLGPFADCRSALELLEDFIPDAALLDIRLEGQETTKEVADLLTDFGVPFAFVTAFPGDVTRQMPAHSEAPVFSKPCRPSDITALTGRLVEASPVP
jgi:CheY-like chemotaxis protein